MYFSQCWYLFCSKYEKTTWNCIYLNTGFEKFSIWNLLTLAFNAAFSREIIVVQSCKRALHILYGKLHIHNRGNTLDLLYDISGPAYFNNLSATTAKKRSAFLLWRLYSLYLCTNVWRKFFLKNKENKSNNKKKRSTKIPFNMHRFSCIFQKISVGDTSKTPQKTGLRPIDGRFTPVLLKHSDNPTHQTFLDPPLKPLLLPQLYMRYWLM